MTERIIAFCGLVCSECEAYQATQANDQAWKERIAQKWREEYHADGITADAVNCDGCQTVGGRTIGYCAECKIRACGRERGVSTCAACADYPGCQLIQDFIKQVPSAKTTLDALREQLN